MEISLFSTILKIYGAPVALTDSSSLTEVKILLSQYEVKVKHKVKSHYLSVLQLCIS